MAKEKVYAYDVEWEIDMDEIYEKLGEMTCEKAAKALELPYDTYANMTTSERYDYAYDCFHNDTGRAAEFMGLPEKIEIPDELTDDEDITNWLSDEYGYFFRGYSLSTDKAV